MHFQQISIPDHAILEHVARCTWGVKPRLGLTVEPKSEKQKTWTIFLQYESSSSYCNKIQVRQICVWSFGQHVDILISTIMGAWTPASFLIFFRVEVHCQTYVFRDLPKNGWLTYWELHHLKHFALLVDQRLFEYSDLSVLEPVAQRLQ